MKWFRKLSSILTFTMICSIILQSGVVLQLKTVTAAEQENSMKLDGFEILNGWTTDKGVKAELVDSPKVEGTKAVKLTFDKTTAGGQWIFLKQTSVPPMDFSTVKGLYVDVYPTSQTTGAREPLKINVSDSQSKMVNEIPVPKLAPNQWTKIYVDLSPKSSLPGDNKTVSKIGFFIDTQTPNLEGRSNVSYYIDNLQIATPSTPVIAACQESGVIAKGTPLSLTTTVDGGKIYYTTDGSNPITSTTKLEYTLPLVIDEDKTITAYVAKEGDANTYLHIFKYKVVAPISIQLTSMKPGNIFTRDESCDLKLTISSKLNQTKKLNILYKVKDSKGNTIYTSRSKQVKVGANSQISIDPLKIPINKMGVFDLIVNVTSKDGSIKEEKITSFSRVLPLIPVQQRADSIFGACTHFGLGRGTLDKNYPIAALGGVFNVRDEMTWGSAETTKGTITIKPAWDEYVNAAVANGLEPLVILDYGNAFYDEGGIPYTQEGINAYIKFATTLVAHFKGKVKHWEIWNEPNLGGFNPTNRTPEDYANLLKSVYPAIKAVDPEAVVAGTALAGMDVTWLNRFLKVPGAVDSMDVMSVHPYSYPTSPEAGSLLDNMKSLEDMIKLNGNKELPLWITEIGWPTHVGPKGVSELESSNNIVRSNVLALTYDKIQKLFWYDLQNDGSNTEYNEDNFGLIRYWNDDETPFAAKQGFVAYNAMSHALTGAKFVGQAHPDTNLNLYKFHRTSENKDVVVAWNMFSSKAIGLNVANGRYKVTDIFGNSENYIVDNGVLNVTLSDSPIYIEGNNITQLDITSPNYSPESKIVNGVAGSTATIKINRTGAVSSKAGQVQVELPDGWKLVGSNRFGAGKTPIELTVSIPKVTSKALYDINLKVLSLKKNILADLFVQVNVTDPVQISIVPKPILPISEGKWSLDVTLTNLLDTTSIQGDLSIVEPLELISGAQPVPTGVITPSGTKTFSIPIGVPSDELYNVKVKVVSNNGSTTEFERKTSFLAADKNEESIAIDGNISEPEWKGSSQFKLNNAKQVKEMPDWGGIDDLSGVGNVKWDSSNLYIAVSATDDVQFQESVGSDIWKGDAIQFSIDTSRIKGAGSSGYHEIGVALSTAGVQKYRWTAANGKAVGIFNEMECSIVRNEASKKTNYEIAIPWNQLLPEGISPKDGDLIGFSLLLNENDTGTRGGWLEYMSGIGYDKNAQLFGDLILAPTAQEIK